MQNRHSHLKSAAWHWLRSVSVCFLFALSVILLVASPVQAVTIITSPLLPQGQIGNPYYATLAAVGTPPYTWSVVSGGLPPGLSLATSGVISGTPAMTGTFNFTAQVTDGTAAIASQPFIITVIQRPLTFMTTDLPAATEGKAYSAVMSVSGGTGPYIYSLNGTLPDGLTLRSTGVITGNPARGTAGTYSITINVTDSSTTPTTGQQSFSLTIQKGGFQVTVTIGSGLKAGETKVIVGNSPAAVLQGGGSAVLPFDLGITTTISVDSVVQHPSNTGIRFKAETDKITVNEFSTTANFPYYAEYSIELKAEPSDAVQLTGSGWYKEGYTLRAVCR